MPRLSWLLVLRVLSLVALTASVALALDYGGSTQSFCGGGTGCDTVRQSGFGYVALSDTLKIPVPLLGIVGFVTLFGASLGRPEGLARRALLPLSAYVGGAVGLGLFLLQALQIGALCAYCVAVDACAVGAALAAYRGRRWQEGEDPLQRWAWLALGGLALFGPRLWLSVAPKPPVPPGVLALYAPGKINVVEFADFECPFCRALHPRLTALLAPYGEQVHLVRRHVPLPSHPHAAGAAAAAVCAEAQGKGEAMAAALMTLEDLGASSVRRRALELGLEAGAFDACLSAPSTKETLTAHVQLWRDADPKGLPTTYIGDYRFVGTPETDDALREALARTAEQRRRVEVPLYAFGGALLAAAALIAFVGRRRAEPGDAAR